MRHSNFSSDNLIMFLFDVISFLEKLNEKFLEKKNCKKTSFFFFFECDFILLFLQN